MLIAVFAQLVGLYFLSALQFMIGDTLSLQSHLQNIYNTYTNLYKGGQCNTIHKAALNYLNGKGSRVQ